MNTGNLQEVIHHILRQPDYNLNRQRKNERLTGLFDPAGKH